MCRGDMQLGGPGVCVSRPSSAGGNRSCRDLLLERPQQRCWCCCSVPRCAQQPSAHSSAAKAEAELFGARQGGLCWGSFYPPSRRSRDVRLWCLMLRLGIWARIRKWEWPGVPDVSPFQLWAWLLQLKLQLLQQSLWSELCGSEALLFQRECICQQDEAGGSWPLGAGRSGRGPVQLQVGVKTNQPINQLNKHKTKQKQPYETAAG